MKKFIILILFSLSLFISCSSIYENHHRESKIVITLPKASVNNSRQIYQELPPMETLNQEELTFTVTLNNREEEISKTGKSGETLNFTVNPGDWDVSCLLSSVNYPDFAYDVQTVTVKSGKVYSINLSPKENLKNLVTKIELAKTVSKSTYYLDDPLETAGVEFKVNLRNGYSFYYDDASLEDLNYNVDIKFVNSADTQENQLNSVITAATRFYYNIMYVVKDGEKLLLTESSPVTLNAKKPVITQQPVSTHMKINSGTCIYEFNVNIEEDSKLGTITYSWGKDHPFLTAAAGRISETSQQKTYTGKYENYGNIYGVTDRYEIIYCQITNTDNKDGLNGNKSVTVESNRVYLYCWSINNYPSSNSDTDCVFVSGNIEYARGESIISSANDLSLEDFKITNTFRKLSGSSSINLTYEDYSPFTLESVQLSEETENKKVFGYVPYDVTINFEDYEFIAGDGSTNNHYKPKTYEIKQTVYIPTNYNPDANLNFGIDTSFPNRYYKVTSNGISWYQKTGDSQYENFTEEEKSYVKLANIDPTAWFYSKITHEPNRVKLFDWEIKAYKQIENNVTEINPTYWNISDEDNSVFYYKYNLTTSDDSTMRQKVPFSIYFKGKPTLNQAYKDWVNFSEEESVEKTSDIVNFSPYSGE